jgi:hypothetical protein
MAQKKKDTKQQKEKSVATKVGRKKNPDKKQMIGTYHRPSEIEQLGGKEGIKTFIYDAVQKELSKPKK